MELLNQRYDVLNAVYDITKNTDLSDELIAAENYINMVEKRELLVVQFEEICKALDALVKDDNTASLSSEEDELREKTDALMKEIALEDKRLREEAKCVMSSIGDNLTKIKNARSVKKHYEYDIYFNDSLGKGFDKKN